MHLTAEDADGHAVTVTGAVPEAARSRAVTAEEVETRLRKTGGTAFSAAHCTITLDGGLAVSAARSTPYAAKRSRRWKRSAPPCRNAAYSTLSRRKRSKTARTSRF